MSIATLKKSTDYEALLEKARVALDSVRYDDATNYCIEAINQRPNDARPHFLLGQAYYNRYLNEQSLHHYLIAAKISPKESLVHIHLGNVYQRMRMLDKSADSYALGISLQPENPKFYVAYIFVLDRINRNEEADKALEKALKLDPKNPMIQYLAGRSARRRKDLKAAYDFQNLALSLNPPSENVHLIWAELSKVAEADKDYDKAYEYNTKAQQCASQTSASKRISTGLTHRIIADSYKFYTKEKVLSWRNEKFPDGYNPAFLVGFPRSGTTLLEQVCFAHPNIITTDERVVVGHIAQSLDQIVKWPTNFPNKLDELRYAEIAYLRHVYMKEMERQVPEVKNYKRILDKNPMNIFLLGFINRLFPESKVVVMIRDPRDVVLSCFFQVFAPNADTVHFYSLEETAKYYAEVMGLYLQYRKNLNIDVLELRYEDLVADFPNKAKQTIAFLGEPWHENVLDFYKGEQKIISTPSHEGINQPIYNKSVEKWRRYEKHFESSLPYLEPFIKEFGYK